MDDDVFDGLVAGSAGSADVSEAATAPESPEQAAPPPETQTGTVETDSQRVATNDVPTEPTAVDWNSEANPHFAAAQRLQEMEATAARIREMQAQQQLSQSIDELADGDAQRQQQLYAVIDQIAAPLKQENAALSERTMGVEKSATALWVAAKAVLSEGDIAKVRTTMAQLMTADSPELMERIAFTERDASKKYGEQLSLKDQEIAELRKQLGVKALVADRAGRGADVVDAGRSTQGTAPSQSNNFDDWFNDTYNSQLGQRRVS